MKEAEKHPTEVPGFTSMEQLAEMVGNLRYDALEEFFTHLANKLESDHEADAKMGRDQLSLHVYRASVYLDPVVDEIAKCWDISEPMYEDDGK